MALPYDETGISNPILDRLPEGHRAFLVSNPIRGLNLRDEKGRDIECWDDVGYLGDTRRHRWAVEIRAKNGRVVAAVAWRRGKRQDTIHTIGTYVSKRYRGLGIGTLLWKTMLSFSGAAVIVSQPVTNDGKTLVESMREKLGDQVKIRTLPHEEPLTDLRKSDVA